MTSVLDRTFDSYEVLDAQSGEWCDVVEIDWENGVLTFIDEHGNEWELEAFIVDEENGLVYQFATNADETTNYDYGIDEDGEWFEVDEDYYVCDGTDAEDDDEEEEEEEEEEEGE